MKQIAREPVGGIPSVVLQPRFIPKVLDLPTECLDPRKSFCSFRWNRIPTLWNLQRKVLITGGGTKSY